MEEREREREIFKFIMSKYIAILRYSCLLESVSCGEDTTKLNFDFTWPKEACSKVSVYV